jgi:hypothetical protein
MKLTKIQELESELRIYVAECLRLRKIAQQAIHVSGEVELERLKKILT